LIQLVASRDYVFEHHRSVRRQPSDLRSIRRRVAALAARSALAADLTPRRLVWARVVLDTHVDAQACIDEQSAVGG
jgi:hypothetical protein